MGVYMLPRRVHHKMDLTKSNLFWDSEVHKRYHMVKWDVLTRPKKYGGMGFTYNRLMNKCLLAKWIINIDRGDRDMCLLCETQFWYDVWLENKFSPNLKLVCSLEL
jgi:hypothetical protein